MAPDSESAPALPAEQMGRRTHRATALVQGALWGLGGLAAAIGSFGLRGDFFQFVFALVGGFLAGLGVGVASWWYTTYVIDGTELRINSGIITKKSRRIPYERLQSVDIVEPLLARLFGLAELRIEMAGGNESKTPLRFLPLDEAHVLRGVLLERADGVEDDGESPARAPLDETLITEVPPGRIIIGTLLSLDFVFSVVAAVALIVAAIWFDFVIAALGGILPLIGYVTQVVLKRIVAQWGFRLSRTTQGLRIQRGLLERTSQTIPFDRVQGVAIEEPYVWRRLGWQRLEVDVAGYASSGDAGDDTSSSTLLPIADVELARHVVEQLIPGLTSDVRGELRPPESSRVFAPVGWRFRAVGAGPQVFVARSGWIKRTTDLVPHHKTQSVALSQGPLQRRLGLVSLAVHTPKGPVNARGLNLESLPARELAFAQLGRAREARSSPPDL